MRTSGESSGKTVDDDESNSKDKREDNNQKVIKTKTFLG
jgi:hypothetical protein